MRSHFYLCQVKLLMTAGVFERYCLKINVEVWQSGQNPDLHLLNRFSNDSICGCWDEMDLKYHQEGEINQDMFPAGGSL